MGSAESGRDLDGPNLSRHMDIIRLLRDSSRPFWLATKQLHPGFFVVLHNDPLSGTRVAVHVWGLPKMTWVQPQVCHRCPQVGGFKPDWCLLRPNFGPRPNMPDCDRFGRNLQCCCGFDSDTIGPNTPQLGDFDHISAELGQFDPYSAKR